MVLRYVIELFCILQLIYFFMRLMNQNDKLANRKRLMLEDSVTAAEQHAKRARQEYGEHSTMPTVSQPPPYTIHAVSTLSYIFVYLFIIML